MKTLLKDNIWIEGFCNIKSLNLNRHRKTIYSGKTSEIPGEAVQYSYKPRF